MPDVASGDTEENPETDLEVESIEDSIESLNYGLYTKLRFYAFHYNLAKQRCKLISVTWLMGVFLGFGYLLSGQEVGLPLNTLLAISWLSLLSTGGILLLCFLDVGVYHRLTEAIVFSALDLERKCQYIPNVHLTAAHLLLKSGRRTGPVWYDALFYASFILILMAVSAFSLYEYYRGVNHVESLFIGIGSIIAVLLVISGVLYCARRSSLSSLFGKSGQLEELSNDR